MLLQIGILINSIGLQKRPHISNLNLKFLFNWVSGNSIDCRTHFLSNRNQQKCPIFCGLYSIHTQAQKISMAINVFINYGPMDGFHNSTKFFVNFVVVVGLSWQAFMIITTQVLSLYYIVSVEACKIICPPKSHLEDTNSLDAMGIQNDPSDNVCPYTQLQYYIQIVRTHNFIRHLCGWVICTYIF